MNEQLPNQEQEKTPVTLQDIITDPEKINNQKLSDSEKEELIKTIKIIKELEFTLREIQLQLGEYSIEKGNMDEISKPIYSENLTHLDIREFGLSDVENDFLNRTLEIISELNKNLDPGNEIKSKIEKLRKDLLDVKLENRTPILGYLSSFFANFDIIIISLRKNK
jgi:hypothetical protein